MLRFRISLQQGKAAAVFEDFKEFCNSVLTIHVDNVLTSL